MLTPQGYSLDLVVRVGGGDVAVEVDGPSHFWGRAPTGSTRLKRRQLRAFGWSLVYVPYWEWNALNGDQERADYMRRKLLHFERDSAEHDAALLMMDLAAHEGKRKASSRLLYDKDDGLGPCRRGRGRGKSGMVFHSHYGWVDEVDVSVD